MTSSGKNGLNIRTNASPKIGQDHVSGGVSFLWWLAAPVTMFYGNLPKFVNEVKIGNKVKFGNKFKNWCYVWSIESVTVYGNVPECHVTFGRGIRHNVWWDQSTEVLRNSKVRRHDNFRDKGCKYFNKCKSHIGESGLFWLAASSEMSCKNLPE